MKFFINFLSYSRIFCAFLIFLVLVQPSFNNIIAIFLFLYAGFSDYLDGYFARKYNLVSNVGEIIDPVSDKILIIFVYVALSVVLNSFFLAFCSSIIISREVWVSALRDYNSRNNKINATKVLYAAKIKTSIQFLTIFIYLIGVTFSYSKIIFVIADIFLVITVLLTLYTGIIYTYNTFKN